MKTIHIIATIAKVTADTKKTQVLLDLDYDSIDKGPELIDVTGQEVSIDIHVGDGVPNGK